MIFIFYYVQIKDNKIVAKIEESKAIEEVPKDYRGVSFEVYNSIGMIPCSYEEINGEITSVEYIEPPPSPPPEPTETELLTDYIVDVDFRVTMIELGLI